MKPKEFQIEERYLVIKLNRLTDDQHAAIEAYLAREGIPKQTCLVVEPDWRCYMQVEALIKKEWEDDQQQHVSDDPALMSDMEVLKEFESLTSQNAELCANLHELKQNHNRLSKVGYPDTSYEAASRAIVSDMWVVQKRLSELRARIGTSCFPPVWNG